MLKEFKKDDIFHNRIKTYPKCSFYFHNGSTFYNQKPDMQGQFTSSVYPSKGRVNLYEMNVDRTQTSLIYPFITKDGSLTSFKTVTTSEFNSDFSYGDTITSSYPLQATITRQHYVSGQTRTQINALQNTLDFYLPLSLHYGYNNSKGNKSSQEISQIDIPSIFFGSSIHKGSVSLRHYQNGNLISHLSDIKQNGELIEISPSGSAGSGSVAGVVLYNEGFVLLTGSWTLSSGFQWKRFGNKTLDNSSSSFELEFEGVHYIPTLSMLCHARKGELNYSNNPTYIKFGQSSSMIPLTSSYLYKEFDNIEIKNTVKSFYNDPTASFEKQTFISRIGIYDKDKNLIAVAKLAKPVRKRETDSFTFKLKKDF